MNNLKLSELKRKDLNLDHNLFVELGIDSKEIIKNFKKISNKERSLARRIDQEVISFLRKKFNGLEDSDEIFFRRLLNEDEEMCLILHIIAIKQKYFDEDICKELYQREFNEEINSIQLLLFNAYNTRKDLNLLKRFHYTTLLRRKRYVTCIQKNKEFEIDLVNLTEQDVEKAIRNNFKNVAKKKSMNVWYLLREPKGLAIFIFRNAKSRKSLPSIHKRCYQFFEYSRPKIIFLKDKCKKLEIYSGETEESIKYAKSIIYEYLQEKDIEVDYKLSETKSDKSNMGIFIASLINNKDKSLELKQIKFKPKEEENDAIFTISKQKDDIKEVLEKMEETYGTKINEENTIEISFQYKSKNFSIFFDTEIDKIIVYFNPRTNDYLLSDDLVKYLEDYYKLNLNKRSR